MKMTFKVLDEELVDVLLDGDKVGEIEKCVDGAIVFSSYENASFTQKELQDIWVKMRVYEKVGW